MQSLNTWINQHIGLSILLCIVMFLAFFYVLHLWQKLSEFCGDLWNEGWDSFKRKWSSWGILKQLMFVVLYILMVLGWILFGVFMLFAAAVATGSAVESHRRHAQYKKDIHDIARVVRKED